MSLSKLAKELEAYSDTLMIVEVEDREEFKLTWADVVRLRREGRRKEVQLNAAELTLADLIVCLHPLVK